METAIDVEGKVDPRSVTKGQKRTVTFNYPGQHHPSGLRKGLVLELGSRGGALPSQTMSIRSLIAEHGQAAGIPLDFEEAAPFDIRVLDPVRTLIEKLMILHHAAMAGDRNEQVRHARHYYDVWCLLNDPATKEALSQSPADALAREVATFTKQAGLVTSPRPRGGFARSPAFTNPAASTRDAFDQQVLGELIWVNAPRPTFDECCSAVVDNAELL